VRFKGIPDAVSAIVMKLLAKTSEERYQTAIGVERDLRRCLGEWEKQHRIVEFPLGKQDMPDRLMIPEKLYGRESEIKNLLAAFDRVVSAGKPELVLVSGYSGIGKSSVVNELHKPLVPPRGLFASGKFDQYKRDIRYATLAQAFQSLIRRLLGKSAADLAPWRHALREALGPNGRLIIDLVPELELIIGAQPPVPDLPPQDALLVAASTFILMTTGGSTGFLVVLSLVPLLTSWSCDYANAIRPRCLKRLLEPLQLCKLYSRASPRSPQVTLRSS
jgi:hypothetical protein